MDFTAVTLTIPTTERVSYQLARVERDMRACLDKQLAPLDISLTHWAVLSHLMREPGLSVAGLAERTLVTQQAVSLILAKLEHQKRITRHPNPRDGRSRILTVTRSGQAICHRCDERVLELENAFRRALGENVAHFFQMLAALSTVCTAR